MRGEALSRAYASADYLLLLLILLLLLLLLLLLYNNPTTTTILLLCYYCTPTFTGLMRGEALSRAYASADVFVMPSESETLGFVVLEAMASGVPTVCIKNAAQ